MAVLDLSFYQRKTEIVARELLGKKLTRIFNGHRLSGIITEVEAYLGIQDKACHTYGDRRTPRTEAMYEAGGHAYIYFIYGMHHCFNVVTEKNGVPEAVLIRALEPVEGLSWMKKFRKTQAIKNLTTGPGKLAQALQLTKELNGQLLSSKDLFIEYADRVPASEIVRCPRIGVSYAGDHAAWPLRFYLKESPYISKREFFSENHAIQP